MSRRAVQRQAPDGRGPNGGVAVGQGVFVEIEVDRLTPEGGVGEQNRAPVALVGVVGIDRPQGRLRGRRGGEDGQDGVREGLALALCYIGGAGSPRQRADQESHKSNNR